jgi:hypothetical protein
MLALDRAVAATDDARPIADTRRPRRDAGPDRHGPRELVGAAGRTGAAWRGPQLRALQRAAGNRAVADLVGPAAGSPAGHTVQRCGDVDPSVCPCHGGDGEGAAAGAGPSVQRLAPGPSVQRAVTATQAESIAVKLEDAMSGWGTDEDAIYGALAGRTGADMTAIKRAYRSAYRKDLDAELADELNSSELAKLGSMMAPVADESTLSAADQEQAKVDSARVIADQLRDAMEGLGTDEEQIFGALSGRTPEEVGEIKRQYEELTGRTLERDLQDELSGSDLRRALNLVDSVGEWESTSFSECTPEFRAKIREFVPIARAQVRKAIVALSPGWDAMDPTAKASFTTYFDPGNTGTIDARFVRLVRDNFLQIAAYMDEGLDFDCDLASGSICGDGYKWCGSGAGNGRLYWTCFGDLHVCANATWLNASDKRRWSDIIHESTHNALHTTDRAYCGTTSWPGLTPYGTGALSVLDEIPVVGFIFKLAGGGGDTLNNPDSYSHFADER